METKICKILVVDDEPDVGVILKHNLSLRNFNVTAASSGEEALRYLAKEEFDLVVLDIILHGTSGHAVARIIKKTHPKTKIIVITAYPDEANQLNYNLKLDGCLIKPAGIEEIYNKILSLN
ncbi:MAG: response regulator [Candidatus Omnitrophota bacterium]|nr:response regulator [Candidatus Omnitrophota bacterium]